MRAFFFFFVCASFSVPLLAISQGGYEQKWYSHKKGG